MCDSGIYKHFLSWKVQVEHVLQGPLHELAEEQQVHYLWIWSGTEGNKLIERFKAEGSIISTGVDQTDNKLDTYWNCFQSALKMNGIFSSSSATQETFSRKYAFGKFCNKGYFISG